MKIESIEKISGWKNVLNAARNTVNLSPLDKEPSVKFKKRILLAAHSPIRCLIFLVSWKDLPYNNSVHFSRHNNGVDHFVGTQRADITGVDRDELPQNNPVRHTMQLNAEAIINMSKKRLCGRADRRTIRAWEMFLDKLKDMEPELYSVCFPTCVYMGFCPEGNKCCGRLGTNRYKHERESLLRLSAQNMKD